jgi:glycosyltransferase involved in cell wall biosynthesis
MDVVSSYRVKAYCDHFAAFNIKPTLLTHRWEKKGSQFLNHSNEDAVIVEEKNECRIIRLPYPGTHTSRSVLRTSMSYMTGNLDVYLMASYKVFKDYLFQHLQKNKYQLIIAIYNPHFHLKLAYECWREFNVPYVLDFRDLWDNEIVTESYQPDLRRRLLNFMISRWWRKWIRHSLFFSTTGDKWRRYLSRLSHRDGIIIRNGFDPVSSPEQNNRANVATGKFKIIHFGRMYKSQNTDIFLTGFKKFAENYSAAEVCVEIIGLKKVPEIDYELKIKSALKEYVAFIPYMPKHELVTYCRSEAALFFFPNFNTDNGQFPVKLYDYTVIEKNIIVSPGGGEISDFIRDTRTGHVFNDPDTLADYLRKAFKTFAASGSVSFVADQEKLVKYSRRNQVRIMAQKIVQCLQKSND